MKVDFDVSDSHTKNIKRCASVIRKHGWQNGAHGMMVLLSGPIFCHEDYMKLVDGYYSRKIIDDFMRMQDSNY